VQREGSRASPLRQRRPRRQPRGAAWCARGRPRSAPAMPPAPPATRRNGTLRALRRAPLLRGAALCCALRPRTQSLAHPRAVRCRLPSRPHVTAAADVPAAPSLRADSLSAALQPPGQGAAEQVLQHLQPEGAQQGACRPSAALRLAWTLSCPSSASEGAAHAPAARRSSRRRRRRCWSAATSSATSWCAPLRPTRASLLH
jgi:hypothetical protein